LTVQVALEKNQEPASISGEKMNRNAGTQVTVAKLMESPWLASRLLRTVGIVVAGNVLLAVCAHVSVPLWFTPVPVTLQPFAVLLLGLLLDPQVAFATMLSYLAEGAAGMPVFTPHGLGGIAQLLGPTGGYLLSYPVVAPMVSALWRSSSRSYARGLLIAGAGSLVTLSLGAAWLAVLTHATASTVLNHAVLPFLPGDVLKVCAATGIAVGYSRWRREDS
jgi:biotin transport system substrate-specific component